MKGEGKRLVSSFRMNGEKRKDKESGRCLQGREEGRRFRQRKEKKMRRERG